MTNFKIILLLILFSQALMAQSKDDKLILQNPRIVSDSLENGFKYIIKAMPGDRENVNMNLIVKAGSNQEDPDQEHLAHLLEHLAFNATENFPDLRNNTQFFANLNMKPTDLMAKVGGNNTQYKFNYNQAVPEALDTALAVYQDIATGKVLFRERDVHAERKAIYQEKLLGINPAGYSKWKILSALTECTLEPTTEDIKSSVMNSSTTALKRFYKKWYRPDLMVLVIVGNIKDISQVESKIKTSFQNIQLPNADYNKDDCDAKYLNTARHFIVENIFEETNAKAQSDTEFQFYFRNNRIYNPLYSRKENNQLWNLITDLINQRLLVDQARYNVSYSNTVSHNYLLPAELLQVWASGNKREAITRTFGILKGISEDGFAARELEALKQEKSKSSKQQDSLSTEFVMNVLSDLTINNKSIKDWNKMDNSSFIQGIELGNINEIVKNTQWLPDDIALIVPENKKEHQYSRKLINQWIEAGLSSPQHYKPKDVPKSLIPEKERSGLALRKIVESSTGAYNEKILILENGVRIILKDQEPKEGRYKNKIIMHGYSPHGAGSFKDSYMEALFAPSIIKNSGYDRFNKFEIEEVLDSTSLRYKIHDKISYWETSLRSEFDPKDLEVLLQLVYLKFTSQRYDPEAFEDWKSNEAKRFEKMVTKHNNDFIDFVDMETGIIELPKGSRRYKESLKVTYEGSLRKYQRLHSKSSNFTFIFTGSLSNTSVLPLIQKYLGNLPNAESQFWENLPEHQEYKYSPHDAQVRFDTAIDNKFLSILYRMPLDTPMNKEEIKLEFLKQALNLKLKKLRYEKKLGTYFFAASGTINAQLQLKEIQIYLQCNPEDYQLVVEACNEFIDELQNEVVSIDNMKTIKNAIYLPKWTNDLADSNASVSKKLYNHYRFNTDYISTLKMKKYIDEFSPEDLRNTAIEYFKEDFKSIMTNTIENR